VKLKAVFFCFLVFNYFIADAQKDGEKISRLLLSADSTTFISFERTIELADQAEHLIVKKGIAQFPEALIHCYEIRILTCRYFQRLKQLRRYVAKNSGLVDSLRINLGQSYAMAKVNSKISWAHFYYEINDYTRALGLFSESLIELRRLPQTPKLCDEESRVIGYIALIHNARGEFEAAINQFDAAIPYEQCAATDRKSNFPVEVLLYRNIGRIYLNKGDLKKGKEFLAKATQLFLPYSDHSVRSSGFLLSVASPVRQCTYDYRKGIVSGKS
jgi:tetratricopeptide (TPR) repeat protein